MNKNLVTFSLIMTFVLTTAVAMAESTIYTDGIGRMHFLGKDPGSNTTQYNYANPAQQDLTRHLYENTANEVNYVDHPLKNYENTFSDSRFTNAWKRKFQSNVDDAAVSRPHKSTMTFEKGAQESSLNTYGTTIQNK